MTKEQQISLLKQNAVSRFLLHSILLLIIISVFVPFSSKMPAPGLDSSWALGLNQAIAQGLIFGKDIIFTLGPYSAIYTKAYHPSTDWMMISGSLYLALSYWFCLIFLLKGVRWPWAVLFALVIFAMIYSRDSLLFSYPLLVGLACGQMISGVEQQSTRYPFYLFIFFLALGLLPLIKGSLLILAIMITILCCLFFLVNQRKDFAFICLISPFISLSLFWLAAGQPLNYLSTYITSTLDLSSGFTEAMATAGMQGEVNLYLINSLLIFLFILWYKPLSTISRFFIFSIYFIFLFISFKTAFTRHYGHAFIASSSILIATHLLSFIFYTRALIFLIAFSLNTWIYINNHYTHISLINNIKSTYTAAWFGLKNRINDAQGLKQDFDLSLNFLQEQMKFPLLRGNTDIYSANQAYLIASANTWSPRPVFQSYSVFNAELAERNKNHLLGRNRPDNIIFNIEPIDKRLPALEDGLSWPFLIANYRPVQLSNQFIILQKTLTSTINSLKLLRSEKHFLGETIFTPQSKLPLFIEVEIKPTLWGNLVKFFYKPTQLKINLELANGAKKEYRFITNMAKSGFILSPLIENTTEFTLLFDTSDLLKEKMVKSFQISVESSLTKQWHNAYEIRYKTCSN